MIFLLLKNKKLRVQLFLGFLLLIGTMPNESEGVKCALCADGDQLHNLEMYLKGSGISVGGCASPASDECRSDEVCYVKENGDNRLAKCATKAHDGCKDDVCFCDKELCNKNKASAEEANKAAGGGSGGPGQSTPNGKLVFTILIAPIFYGYLRGGMAEAAA